MGRVAVLAGGDPGHALPMIGLAGGLHRAGDDVRLLTGAQHRATAARHALSVEPLPVLPPDPRDQDIGHRLWGRAAGFATLLADRLSAEPPQVVVTDTLLPGGGLAAQLLGVPWVELIPHHLPDPAPDLPPVGLGRRRSRSPVRRADDRRLHRAQLRSIQAGAAQAHAAARTIGLDAPASPVLRLVATVPALERSRVHWPPDAHVVGPLAVDPALPPLSPPPGPEPLVVVTDSTVASPDRTLGEVARRALVDLPVRAVITSSALPAEQGDRLTVGVGPHGPLLAEAALALGPGGGGFVSKVLTAGIAMVVVPLAGDQREAAARLRDTRVGRVVPPARLSACTLRWAVLRHLADRPAREAAAALARQAAALGPDLAAALVAAVADGRAPPASGPDHHLRTSERRWRSL